VKTVTRFQSDDGILFDDEHKCRKHQNLIGKINVIMMQLPDGKPGDGKFAQHDKAVLRAVKEAIWELILSEYGNSFPAWKGYTSDGIGMFSIVGRVLGESNCPLNKALNKAWGTLLCYDFDNGKQYSQPYFVLHQDEARTLQVQA